MRREDWLNMQKRMKVERIANEELKKVLELSGMTSEQFVKKKLLDIGIKVYKKGWPDFLCVLSTGRLVAVEAKKSSKSRLTKDQKRIRLLLERAGIPVVILWPGKPALPAIRDAISQLNSGSGFEIKKESALHKIPKNPPDYSLTH